MKYGRGVGVGAIALLIAALAWAWQSHSSPPRRIAQAPVAALTPMPTRGPTLVPRPSPTPTVRPTQRPVLGPTAAPTSGPTPSPTPIPTPIPTPVPTPLVRAPNEPPQIVAMSIDTPVVHAGDLVSGTVLTSTNVASVEARIGGYSSSMRKISAGRFAIRYRVPTLPFFLHRTFEVQVIARNAAGQTVSSGFPITVK